VRLDGDRLWLAIAISAAILCALMALRMAFANEYVAPVDGKLHAFWTARLGDPALFRHDLLADYCDSIGPLGFRLVFALGLTLGLDTLTIVKLLPLVLSPVTAYYGYRLTRQLFQSPMAGFFGSALLTEAVWMNPDIASGAARAFVCPLLTAFLYYSVRRHWIGVFVTVVGLAAFYPPVAVVAMGVVALEVVRHRPWQRSEVTAGLLVLVVAVAVLAAESGRASRFGPTLTLEEAARIPELQADGPIPWFVPRPVPFWTTAHRSGILPLFEPPLALLGWGLPVLVAFRDRWPAARRIGPEVDVLGTACLVSIAGFVVGHMLAFRMYQPSRFTLYTARILLATGAGVVLGAGLGALNRRGWRRTRVTAMVLSWLMLLGTPIVLRALNLTFPKTTYDVGRAPELYRFLELQPKDVVIASLSGEADNIPIFTRRAVLVARDFGLPWHKAYYRSFRERTSDLIVAQYSGDLEDVQAFIRKYGVGLWLVDRTAFWPEYLRDNRWVQLYPAVGERALQAIQAGPRPAIMNLIDRCARFQDERRVVVSAACVLAQRPHQ
jgi:hypothetical protein